MPDALQFEDTSWYQFLDAYSQELVLQARYLLEREERLPAPIRDYAFVVFPMAKAYEGFLKSFFFRIGVLSVRLYENKQFRIGRSFNPDLAERYKDEYWIYDDVSRYCSERTARKLWDVWIESRNHLFHYFPKGQYRVSKEKARILIEDIQGAMEMAMSCTITSNSMTGR